MPTPPVLLRGQGIGVSSERDVGHVLQPHDTEHTSVASKAEKFHAGPHFGKKLFARHVGLVPAVGGNHAAIGDRGVVDDGADRFGILNRLGYLRPLGSGSPSAR